MGTSCEQTLELSQAEATTDGIQSGMGEGAGWVVGPSRPQDREMLN